MSVSIHQLIAAICPDVFCHPSTRREVKRVLRDRASAGDPAAYLKAAAVAKPQESNLEDLDRLQETNPFDLPGLKAPIEKHTLVYDAPGDSLERVYFTLLDLLERQLGWPVTKLVDLVHATPGSTLVQQWGQRSTRAIDETVKLFHTAQEDAQRLLSTLEELRRTREQLWLIDDFRSSDSTRHAAATEALELEWQKCTPGPDPGDDLQRSDENRQASLHDWLNERQRQLSARSSSLAGEARAHLQTLRLYAQLLQPMLGDDPDPAEQAGANPGLLNVFNTASIRVVLLAQKPDFREDQISSGKLPKWLGKPRYRPSIPTLLVEIVFRAMPEEAKTGGFVYRGRAEITVASYALREDELRLLQLVLEQAAIARLLRQMGVAAEPDLRAILSFFEESRGQPPEDAAVESQDGPFQALWAGLRDLMMLADGKEIVVCPASLTKPDSTPESVLRSDAAIHAREKCQWLWHESKAALRMVAA